MQILALILRTAHHRASFKLGHLVTPLADEAVRLIFFLNVFSLS